MNAAVSRLVTVRRDITQLDVDVVVNAANGTLLGGGGVDGAIHRAAGPSLLEQCRVIVAREGNCETGHAVITGAGDMAARHVVHTVGPIWGAEAAELQDRQLAACYRRSLALAAEAGAVSVAFPNISTGVYRFPKHRAAAVAINAVRGFIADETDSTVDRVLFCCFDAENESLYRARLAAG